MEPSIPMLAASVVAGAVLLRGHRRKRVTDAEIEQVSSAYPVSASDPTVRCAPDLAVSLGTAGAVDIARAPHLLVAGATGSGKSVLLTSMITDLLNQYSPDQLKLVLVDPKRVELAYFRDAPHVASFTYEPHEAVLQLELLGGIMEERYRTLARLRVRNIDATVGMPRIVVVVDELANLMLSAYQKRTEQAIVRLGSMARAVGIHLVLATQRPSVDVVTGLIKANVPARIALATATAIDSRVILDMKGAEALVGRGDMLALFPHVSRHPVRSQGPMRSDAEVAEAVRRWR